MILYLLLSIINCILEFVFLNSEDIGKRFLRNVIYVLLHNKSKLLYDIVIIILLHFNDILLQ